VQRVAEAVFGRLKADTDFTVQDLMGELQSADDRRLVSDLYEQAQIHADHTAAPSAAERLQAACAALSKVQDDESYREGLAAYRRDTRDTTDADALREQIKKRRKQGDLPAAMPLRVRS
jgi:polyhydroxyalkanoate synthesis regulator phasin